MIDRHAPTLRPPLRNDGTQRWESLLFLHWHVDANLIRQKIPASLELDTFEGRAFIGLVPFKMRQIRPRWLPKFAAFNFLETNVRTYVIHQGRPGVYFFSLDANSALAVIAARIGWSLPYFFSRMNASVSETSVSYSSKRRIGEGASLVEARVGERFGEAVPGSLEFFLFERYLLFVQQRSGIFVGQVHHPPYEIFNANAKQVHLGLIHAAGFPDVSREPMMTHYSPGVDVEVFGIRPA